MDLSKLKGIFVEETMEKLEELENGLLQLEKSSDDKELLNTIFRAAHTIKGSGGSLGFNDISKFTHRMEELLDLVRQDKLIPDKEMINTLLEATDMIKEMTENISTDSEFAFERCGPLMTKMEGMKIGSSQQSAISGQPTVGRTEPLTAISNQQAEDKTPQTETSSPETQTYRIIFAPDIDMLKRGIDPSIIIEDLKGLGEIISINADIDTVPELHELDPETLYLRWDILLRTDKGIEEIKKIFEFVEEGSEIKILPVTAPEEGTPLLGKLLIEEGIVKPCDVKEALKTQKRLGDILVEQGKAAPEDIQKALDKQNIKKADSFKAAVSSSIRVDIGKLETLTNLVSEMVIIQSMFQQALTTGGQGAAVSEGDNGHISEKVDQLFSHLQRIGKDIQESAMSLRMLPVGEVFQRFARLVRELSANKNKNIELVITGEDTELDKGILEKITDPLVHLIRNSIDHGMETPEERIAAGKPSKGAIHLSAYHMGDSIYIDVSDDGRGLNRRKIIDKAVSKGLINNAETLTDAQVNNLIFLPGFSTADSVTDISGRGVGMDVVKKNIDALNGRVFIRTELGKGTTISIKLPLTLVIIDGLTVLVGDETFVIPLSSVVETIRPGRNDVRTLNEKGEVIDVRGEYIPLLRLYKLLGISAWNENPWDAIIIVTAYEGRKYCLLIDDLLGQQQVVIKSLGTAVPKISDIAGGTILGDGKVALVLDVPGLIEKTMQKTAVVG